MTVTTVASHTEDEAASAGVTSRTVVWWPQLKTGSSHTAHSSLLSSGSEVYTRTRAPGDVRCKTPGSRFRGNDGVSRA